MIITIDTETYREEGGELKPILDATGDYFVLGCLLKESGKKKTFLKPKEMWDYIIDLGRTCFNNDKRLTVYGHNIHYEFYQTADLHDRNLRWFSEKPFIAGYYMRREKEMTEKEYESWKVYAGKKKIRYEIEEINNGKVKISMMKEAIKFLDSMALYNMSLEKMGKIIGKEKMKMPEKITKSKEDMRKLEEYCMNDCIVTMEAVRHLKAKLKKDGIKIRNLCTINQIAISYVLNKLKKEENEHILKKNRDGKVTEWTHKTRHANEIHQAYRGGYVRVWKTGRLENVTAIDFNSLYPYSAMVMKFPDMRTEIKLKEPLKYYGLEILNEIGVSKAMVYNERDELGLLQIRMEEKSYVPKKGKYILGVWTNRELKKAIENGYKLIDIEWTIKYNEGKNPFKEIFTDIYNKRKEAKNDLENYFYKMMMNASIGKFGQTRVGQEIVVDSVEKIYEYLNKGYERKNIEGSTDMFYINKEIKGEKKKYYAPIIPALITAEARCIMYDNYKKVPIKDLVYTDTDSIITIGDYRSKFNIGKEIGQFKVDEDIETKEPLINTKALIWGTKTKAIGNNIAVSGVYKSSLNKKDFEEGKLTMKRMVGMKNAGSKRAGSFIEEERNLVKQCKDFWEGEEILNGQKLFFDIDIKDVEYFMKYLSEIDKRIIKKEVETNGNTN